MRAHVRWPPTGRRVQSPEMAGQINHPVRIGVDQAGAHLPVLVDQALGGNDVIITRDDDAAVRLVPVATAGAVTRPILGAAKGVVLFMADDFDAPIGDFAEYT